jgi:pyruvate dehydrogenase phosphatase regulatory subunit
MGNLDLFAGFWSRHVGELSVPAVAVPIQPAEHYHLHTKPVPDLPPDTPVVRDPDGYVYFRENEGRFLAGGFEPRVSACIAISTISSIPPNLCQIYCPTPP